ncbi:MAG: DNA polymerase IV [Actinobacteria bacterium]|nr:DNA polymerase IV [Actinomycetota bacterium]
MGRSADMPRQPTTSLGDDTGCAILHVDMDAFFASVEVRHRPELRGRPVIVGGGTRAVVAAASYEARAFGVRSAMPMTRARRLCPQAVVVPPRRGAYSEVSAQVMSILRDVTPSVEPLSLDEAFLDVSGAVRLLGRPTRIAERIRARVLDDLGLTCSVGVASTKFIAKLASARCKPDGLLVVPAQGALAFLHPLPVTVLWGVGAATAEPLRRLGVRTVGDLAQIPVETLRRSVGAAAAAQLNELASGRDAHRVEPRAIEKSISADHTTDTDLTESSEIHAQLRRLSVEVGRRLRGRAMLARTVGIKIRFADFRTVTRVRSLPAWVDSDQAIQDAARALYDGLALDRPRVRLVGVKVESLRVPAETATQLSFDDLAPVNRADRAIDDVRARFGDLALDYGRPDRAGGQARSPRSAHGRDPNVFG